MRRFSLLAAICLSLLMSTVPGPEGTAGAQTLPEPSGAPVPGWDRFDEPIDTARSSVAWRVHRPSRTLHVIFRLAGATPGKVYQVGVHQFVRRCELLPSGFGAYPYADCGPLTREGKTATAAAVELGAIVTDQNGDGTVRLEVPSMQPGVYRVAFHIRDGAGCNVIGGGPGATCTMVFRTPAPFPATRRFAIN